MKNDNFESFKQIISRNGYRLTVTREAIFKALASPEPQSLAEIITRTKGKVDRVSIYRSIELFERLGIVNRINVGWKYKIELSDKFVDHHHHMSCLDCGVVFEINEGDYLDELIHKVTSEKSFTPIKHTFEIEGHCKGCK